MNRMEYRKATNVDGHELVDDPNTAHELAMKMDGWATLAADERTAAKHLESGQELPEGMNSARKERVAKQIAHYTDELFYNAPDRAVGAIEDASKEADMYAEAEYQNAVNGRHGKRAA